MTGWKPVLLLVTYAMRILMMGTGPFAVPTFRALFETHHEVIALVASPLRPQRGKELIPLSPMRDIAHQQGVPIFDPDNINDTESQIQLSQFDADLMVVCDYGQILSAETLATASMGGINLHASLLPKYRGAAPINWAIYDGERQTGVTVIHMTPRVDAGPCIAQAATEIEPEETAVELEVRLSELGAWLVRRTIDAMETGSMEALPQNPELASKAPRLKKTDGLIFWYRPALAIKDQIRAMEPWPKTYTFWHRKHGPPLRVIFGPVDVEEFPEKATPPGTVLRADELGLSIATGSGAVAPQTVQPAGKRVMSVEEFLRGYPVQPGDRFADEKG
jgi:methionyl-tRNA formyltransferase